MVRDARHRSQVYVGCAYYGRAPHHEEIKLVLILRSPPKAGVSKDGAKN